MTLSSWEQTTIGQFISEFGGEIKTGPFGTKLKAAEYSTNGVPVISVGEVDFGRLVTHQRTPFVGPEVTSRMPEYVLHEGDIVFGRKGAVERSARVSADQAGWFLGSDGIRLRLPSNCDNRFVAYQFLSREHRQWMIQHATGSTMPSLNQRIIERIPILLPPIDEQKAIANILGTLDDKIELNRRMNETLESMARALFKSWFVDFDPVRAKMDGRQPPGLSPEVAALFPDKLVHVDGELIPEGWEQTTLGKEVDFQTGFPFKSKLFTQTPPGVRLARGMNVKEGQFYWDSQARFWPAVSPDIAEYQLQSGDVLIGMDGSKVGKNWVRVREADLPCLLVQRVARLRPAKSIGENAIWILIGDPAFRYYVDAVKTGTSIPHISGGQIKSYTFIRPPSGDDRLFDCFERIVAPLTKQADINLAESNVLRLTRDTLLPTLLSGDLQLNDVEQFVEDY